MAILQEHKQNLFTEGTKLTNQGLIRLQLPVARATSTSWQCPHRGVLIRVCGAVQLLQELKATLSPDVLTFSTLISCCASAGGATDTAMALLAEMQVSALYRFALCLLLVARGKDPAWRVWVTSCRFAAGCRDRRQPHPVQRAAAVLRERQ